MQDIIKNSLKKGLSGAFSHIDPLEAVSDLTVDVARKRIKGISHSIWELLYHLVVWQEVFTENIKGNNPDWQKANIQSWPTEESMNNNNTFHDLLKKYKKGFKELETLIDSVNLTDSLPFAQDNPVIQLIITAITHNSYHIGQIMLLKKI